MLQIQRLRIIMEKLKPRLCTQQPVERTAWGVLSVKQLTGLNFASDRADPTDGTPTGRWYSCLCDTKILELKIAESSLASFYFPHLSV